MKLELLSASEVGELVNKREIKPSEVIKYFIDRIEKRNKSVNAFTFTEFDYALKKAEEYDKNTAPKKHHTKKREEDNYDKTQR